MRNAWERNAELMKKFQSAKSLDKKLKLFEKMEKLIPESDLGIECWTLAGNLFQEDRSLEQVLSFGNRALRIFISNSNADDIPFMGKIRRGVPLVDKHNQCEIAHNSSFYIACVCHLLTVACYRLKRYDESFSYLNWANRNLCKLLEGGDCVNNCLSDALAVTQIQLSKVKEAMGGKWEEVVVHINKALEIMETIMENDCIEIGEEYARLLAAYLALENYEEALPCCLRALEIYKKHFGSCSVEAAKMIGYLAYIYSKLGNYKKALEQNQLSQSILKNTAPDSPDVLNGEYKTSCILFGLGRYEEAIDVSKRVVSDTVTERSTRGLALVKMAYALFRLGKCSEAKKQLKTAQSIFRKKDMLPISVVAGFMDMSILYEDMDDFGKATSLLWKALNIPEIPLNFLAKCSARLFSLISLSDKEKEGIAYMEDLVKILKEKFGADHYEVGYGYRNLGTAYFNIGQEESAVKFMMKARDILNASLGPHHLDSLDTSQALAETYVTLKSYDLAIEIQDEVVKGLIGIGQSEQVMLDEAVSLLKNMENLKCGISE